MAALNLQLMNMYDSSVGSKRRDFLCYATDIFTLNWWNHLKTLYLKILIWYILTCEVLGFKTSKSQSTTKICQGDKWNPSSLRGMTLMTSHVTFIFNGRLRLKLTFTPPFSLEPMLKVELLLPCRHIHLALSMTDLNYLPHGSVSGRFEGVLEVNLEIIVSTFKRHGKLIFL